MIDFLIGAIILISLLIGLARGFIKEAISLSSWLIALWLAYANAVHGEVFFANYFDEEKVRIIAAFITIFVIMLIVASVCGRLLARLLALSISTGVDSSIGVLFGIVRGIILVAVFIVAATYIDLDRHVWWDNSALLQYFTPFADTLQSKLPENLADSLPSSDGEAVEKSIEIIENVDVDELDDTLDNSWDNVDDTFD